MQAKIFLFLPKHTHFLRAEKREDGQQSWQLQSVQWFPNGNNKEKMAQFCSLQLSPECEGVKTWGACTYHFFLDSYTNFDLHENYVHHENGHKKCIPMTPHSVVCRQRLVCFYQTTHLFLRAEKREDGQQSWQLQSVQWFPNGEQHGENGPVL